MTETVQLQPSPKMVQDFQGDLNKWQRESEENAQQSLAAEGMTFYNPRLAFEYLTARDDLRMQCGEGGNGKLVDKLAEMMALVRAQDEQEHWRKQFVRAMDVINLRAERENEAELATLSYGDASHGV